MPLLLALSSPLSFGGQTVIQTGFAISSQLVTAMQQVMNSDVPGPQGGPSSSPLTPETLNPPPGGSYNYLMTSVNPGAPGGCNNIKNISVTIQVNQSFVSDLGFGFQLNGWSPASSQNISWQQYCPTFTNFTATGGSFFGGSDNWNTGVKNAVLSFGFPPYYWNQNAAPALLAGFSLTCSLSSSGIDRAGNYVTDPDDNIRFVSEVATYTNNGAVTTLFDVSTDLVGIPLSYPDSPKTGPANLSTTADLAPIVAFELDAVGPATGRQSFLSSGGGSITYSVDPSTPITPSNESAPPCVGAQGARGTGESANSVYGTLPGASGSSFVQSLSAQPLPPFTPGIQIAASLQPGVSTSVYSVNNSGQLAVTTTNFAASWSVSPGAIGPAGTLEWTTVLAASPQFGAAGQSDVFGIGQGGTLDVYSVSSSGNWAPLVQFTPPVKLPWNAPLATSQQFGVSPPRTDVFVVDNNGTLDVYSVSGSSSSWSGGPIAGPSGLLPNGAWLAASQQFGAPNQTDVFVIDNNGDLNLFSAVGSGNWQGGPLKGISADLKPGFPLAASQQFGYPNQTDVFVVDRNGSLNVFSSAGATGAWSGGPLSNSPPGSLPTGALLTASPQFGLSNQTDVFAVDNNGQLVVYWITAPATEWAGPLTIGPSGQFPPGGGIAVAQDAGNSSQTDVFLIDKNGFIDMFTVMGNGQWLGPTISCEPGFAGNSSTQCAQESGSNTPSGSCPAGQFYDIALQKCLNLLCPVTTNNMPSTCACPAGYYWSSGAGTCFATCGGGLVWNPQTSSCQSLCPAGTGYDGSTGQCVNECPSGTEYNSEAGKCLAPCAAGTTYSESAGQCVTVCSAGMNFNVSANKCVANCPAGEVYSVNVGGCVCAAGTTYNTVAGRCESLPGGAGGTTSSGTTMTNKGP